MNNTRYTRWTVIIVALGAILVASLSFAQRGPYGQGQRAAGWQCPWMGGATGSQGTGWVCPWMGSGYGQAQGRGLGKTGQPGPPPGVQPGQPISQEQARMLLERYAIAGNPNLKLGQLADMGDVYQAPILDSKGRVVDKIQVNKENGWFRSVE